MEPAGGRRREPGTNSEAHGTDEFVLKRREAFDLRERHETFSRAWAVAQKEAKVANLHDFYEDWCRWECTTIPEKADGR